MVDAPRPKRPCCPNDDCESLDVVKRTRIGGYRCSRCGWTGTRAQLNEREPNDDAPKRPQGLAGVLMDMDAGEVP